MHPSNIETSNWTISSYSALNNQDSYENYYCTFDNTCRGYYDKAPYRSCERGLAACVLF